MTMKVAPTISGVVVSPRTAMAIVALTSGLIDCSVLLREVRFTVRDLIRQEP